MLPRVLLVALTIGIGASPLHAQSAGSFSSMLAAYRDGDRDVVARTIGTPAAFAERKSSLDDVLKAGQSWDPAHTAFVLEIAIALSNHSPDEVAGVLTRGRRMVMSRPTPPSRDGRHDTFEVLWHRVAIGLLQRSLHTRGQNSYLDALEDRYPGRSPDAPDGTALDGRFVLARAIAVEQQCWMFDVEGPVVARLTAILPLVNESAKIKVCESAQALLDRARAWQNVTTEANVRAAAIDVRLGKPDAALARLALPRPSPQDPQRDYWAGILEGRIHQQRKQLLDAERAFRAALTAWPDGTTARLGLALVLFELNRREQARALIDEMRNVPPSSTDPWWNFVAGDARLIFVWRDMIRRMLS